VFVVKNFHRFDNNASYGEFKGACAILVAKILLFNIGWTNADHKLSTTAHRDNSVGFISRREISSNSLHSYFWQFQILLIR
jgi:hypothetical protein